MRVDLIQIGDYFAYPTQTIHDGNLKIGRVNFIRHDGIVQVDFVDTNAQLLEPIELTPYILERNGFKKNGIPNSVASIKEMYWCDDTYVWSRQETPDERMFVSVYMDTSADFFVEVYCQYCHADGIHVKYLHELQHVLKLCNIYKDIVL